MKAKCLNCNKSFEAARKTAKYCSDKCKKKYLRKEKGTVHPVVEKAKKELPNVPVEKKQLSDDEIRKRTDYKPPHEKNLPVLDRRQPQEKPEPIKRDSKYGSFHEEKFGKPLSFFECANCGKKVNRRACSQECEDELNGLPKGAILIMEEGASVGWEEDKSEAERQAEAWATNDYTKQSFFGGKTSKGTTRYFDFKEKKMFYLKKIEAGEDLGWPQPKSFRDKNYVPNWKTAGMKNPEEAAQKAISNVLKNVPGGTIQWQGATFGKKLS